MIEEDVRFFNHYLPKSKASDSPALRQNIPAYTNSSQQRHNLSAGSASSMHIAPVTTNVFKTTHLTVDQQVVTPVGLHGGFLKIKNQQLSVLQQLRHQQEELKKLRRQQESQSSRISEVSSASSLASSSAQTSKKSFAKQPNKSYQHQLSMKTRRIQELEYSERELKRIIQSLRLELERKSNEEANHIATIRKIRSSESDMIEKFTKEIQIYKADTEKLIQENTRLKKQLLNKEFELKELMDQRNRKSVNSGYSRVSKNLSEQLAEQETLAQQRYAILEKEHSDTKDQMRRLKDQLYDLEGKIKQKQYELRQTQEQSKYLKQNMVSESDFKRIKQQLENQKILSQSKDLQNRNLEDQIAGLITQITLGPQPTDDKQLIRQELQELRALLMQEDKNKHWEEKTRRLNDEIEELKRQLSVKSNNTNSANNATELAIHSAQISTLNDQIERLTTKLVQNAKLITQLEEASSRAPKESFSKQNELNDLITKYRFLEQQWNSKETQYRQKVDHLEQQYDELQSELALYKSNDQATIDQYEHRISKMQMEWGQKEVEFQQKIHSLEEQVKSKYEEEIMSLQTYIKQIVDTGEENLKTNKQQFQMEMDKIKHLNDLNSEALRIEFQAELEKLNSLHKETESEKRVYAEELAESIKRIETLTLELNTLKTASKSDIAALKAENARLEQEIARWAQLHQIETKKLLGEKEEFAKRVNDRYDHDTGALRVLNQRLVQENQQLLPLQSQYQQLVIVNRQLYAQVKEKSEPVEHLWQIKMAEYQNVNSHLMRLKSIFPSSTHNQ